MNSTLLAPNFKFHGSVGRTRLKHEKWGRVTKQFLLLRQLSKSRLMDTHNSSAILPFKCALEDPNCSSPEAVSALVEVNKHCGTSVPVLLLGLGFVQNYSHKIMLEM